MTSQGRNAVDILLAESLKELAEKQPIDKITIKEITDKAGVIRPTFYNHFQDKYELLEWIIMSELLEPVKPLIRNEMVDQALILLFSNIEKEKEFYIKASRLDGQNSFESIVRQCIKSVLLEVLKDNATGRKCQYPWINMELVAEYHAQSMCFLVLNWLRTGMTISAKEMADTYNYMIRHSIEDVLKEI